MDTYIASYTWAWIGITKTEHDTWVSMNNTPLNYFNWPADGPRMNDNTCYVMSKTKTWVDASCAARYWIYTCESGSNILLFTEIKLQSSHRDGYTRDSYKRPFSLFFENYKLKTASKCQSSAMVTDCRDFYCNHRGMRS